MGGLQSLGFVLLTILSTASLAKDYKKGAFEEDFQYAREALKNLQDKGYQATIKNINESSLGWPTLALKHENINSKVHTIEISTNKDGASLVFRIYQLDTSKKCNVNKKILDKIITVHNQRISSYYYCEDVPQERSYTELYLLKTEEGKKFVRDILLHHPYVVIDLYDTPLPFDIRGFDDAWNKLDVPAL